IDPVPDRSEASKARAPRLAARHERTDHAAAVGGGEDAPERKILLVEGGVRRQHDPRAQVDDAEARRPDDADAGARAGLAQARLARDAFGAGFPQTLRQPRRALAPRGPA